MLNHEHEVTPMRWRGERESSNVEDRRGVSRGKVAIGGGLGTLIIIILALLFGADPQQILQQVPQNGPSAPVQSSQPNTQQEDEMKQFVSVVLGKTEDVWTDAFRKNAGNTANQLSYSLLTRINRHVA